MSQLTDESTFLSGPDELRGQSQVRSTYIGRNAILEVLIVNRYRLGQTVHPLDKLVLDPPGYMCLASKEENLRGQWARIVCLCFFSFLFMSNHDTRLLQQSMNDCAWKTRYATNFLVCTWAYPTVCEMIMRTVWDIVDLGAAAKDSEARTFTCT